MKRLLTIIALVGFSAVSLAAVARVVRTELKSSEPFDRAAMETWLTSHDPDGPPLDHVDAPSQVRRGARMLEGDFHDEYDWRPFYRTLDDPAQFRFRHNFLTLARLLFEQRADRYASLRSYERDRYLDAQLKDFSQWYVFDERGKRVRGMEMFLVGARFVIAEQSELGGAADRKAARVRQGTDFLRDLQSRALKKAAGVFRPGEMPPPKRDD